MLNLCFTIRTVIGSGDIFAGNNIRKQSAGRDTGVLTPNQPNLILRRSEKKSTGGFNLQLLIYV